MPLVYEECRRIAERQMRGEREEHTLSPTALVNELYLRLVDQRRTTWSNRAQFFGIAAQMMRRVLVDHARARLAEKRDGGRLMVSLEAADARDHAVANYGRAGDRRRSPSTRPESIRISSASWSSGFSPA